MAMLSKTTFQEMQPKELDLFTIPHTQTAVEEIFYQVSGQSPIEFLLSGQNGMEYLDLSRSRLYVKCKIRTSDGNDLTADEKVGPVNLFLQSFWSQIDITLQGKLITSTNNHYPYKAMMQALLNYGDDCKQTQLTSQLYSKDSPGSMDETNPNGANSGFYERSTFTNQSKSVDMEGTLFQDLLKIKRYILNQVDVGLKLYRSSSSFCLLSDEINPSYEVIIEDIVLRACKVGLNPAIIYGHAEALQEMNAKYPYDKSEIKVMSVPQGQLSVSWDNIFQGSRPNKIIMGLVSTQAISGSYTLNPYNFKNYDVRQITLLCDGVPVGGGPLKLKYSKSQGETIIPAYISLFQVSGQWMQNLGNGIDRDEMGSGYALYGFDLQPTFQWEDYLNLVKQGVIRLELQFGTPLPEGASIIVYSERSGYFEIDQSRNIITEG